ncbi:methyltransferase domain-containing protein [Arhodomonas aquaeolei]|uniref:class I SAM-dependent methyltransferase n=1 Tax=Arhodomonas aquaeolei TaxID=2369 RepID=UPI0021685908|nr:methyltransferase domain-containing protein [Arhodomonas aquaeolei]MCS4505135.1 methyltransferase domain-containing protein [Arhodomonas aquaeolei]
MSRLSADGAFARQVYARIAGYYDPLLWLFVPMGVRLGRYRAALVDGLALAPGDTVVDLGCGTGRNLPRLARAVGPAGRIIGVDVSAGMLERARRRADALGLDNVSLVQADFLQWAGPGRSVDAVCAALTLGMSGDYPVVIDRAAGWLRPGGRFGALEMQAPEGWPAWLVRAGVALNRVFGVRPEQITRRVDQALLARLTPVYHRYYYGGVFTLAVGCVDERTLPS